MNLNQSRINKNCSTDSFLQEIKVNGYDCQKVQKIIVELFRNNQLNFKLLSGLCLQSSSIFSSIGMIRVNWFDQKGALISINYGSGFAVNKKMIVTCLHNVYSENFKKIASEIIFIPALDGKITDQNRAYKCTNPANIKCLIPNQTLSYTPLKEEIVVFKLDDEYEVQSQIFIKIGSLEIEKQHPKAQLQIIGYPSKEYYQKLHLNDVEAKRVALRGEIHCIQGHVIHHTLKTTVGHSGSPILARDQKGAYYAVGVHTHRGVKPDFNSGLFFSQQILQRIKRFEYELKSGDQSLNQQTIFKENVPKFPLLDESQLTEIVDGQQCVFLGEYTNENNQDCLFVAELKGVIEQQQTEDDSNQNRKDSNQYSQLIFELSQKIEEKDISVDQMSELSLRDQSTDASSQEEEKQTALSEMQSSKEQKSTMDILSVMNRFDPSNIRDWNEDTFQSFFQQKKSELREQLEQCIEMHKYQGF